MEQGTHVGQGSFALMESIAVTKVPLVLHRTAEAEEVQEEPAVGSWDSQEVDTAFGHFRVLRMLLSGGSIR